MECVWFHWVEEQLLSVALHIHATTGKPWVLVKTSWSEMDQFVHSLHVLR